MLPTYNFGGLNDSASAPLIQSGQPSYPQTSVMEPIPVAQSAYNQPAPVQPIPVQPEPAPIEMAQPVQPVINPLEFLTKFAGVRIVENINLWEVFTDYNATKRFGIFLTNEDGEVQENQIPIFNAVEESECCQRQMCGTSREFNMHILGPDGQTLVNLHRPFTCQFFCLNTPEMHILDGEGNICGLVKNIWHCCDHVFSIYDNYNKECMTIRGSCLQPGNFCFAPCAPFNEIVFDVTNHRTGTVGHIKRRWDSWARQLFTNADTFTIAFPEESTLHERILLLGATFLLNMMYFEQQQDNNNSTYYIGGGYDNDNDNDFGGDDCGGDD